MVVTQSFKLLPWILLFLGSNELFTANDTDGIVCTAGCRLTRYTMLNKLSGQVLRQGSLGAKTNTAEWVKNKFINTSQSLEFKMPTFKFLNRFCKCCSTQRWDTMSIAWAPHKLCWERCSTPWTMTSWNMEQSSRKQARTSLGTKRRVLAALLNPIIGTQCWCTRATWINLWWELTKNSCTNPRASSRVGKTWIIGKSTHWPLAVAQLCTREICKRTSAASIPLVGSGTLPMGAGATCFGISGHGKVLEVQWKSLWTRVQSRQAVKPTLPTFGAWVSGTPRFSASKGHRQGNLGSSPDSCCKTPLPQITGMETSAAL